MHRTPGIELGFTAATADQPALVLAPMEGLADFWVRQSLTDIGGFNWCVSEFVRVSGSLLPPRVFYRWCPELLTDGLTRSGTPVHVQLLGSDPVCVADNAARVAALGAPAIDLNFGCPAKTVNRHRGGAVLLDEPEVVHAVVAAVRDAVPRNVPVSAKMRLGNCDGERALENAVAIEEAGASWLTVHGRTKVQGYTPPAYWDRIGAIRSAVSLPVIANGEIWTPADAERCMAESGSNLLMLGRGAVADPFLAMRIREQSRAAWEEVQHCLLHFIAEGRAAASEETRLGGRVKQWVSFLRRRWPEAADVYDTLKRCRSLDDMVDLLAS